uniref:DNA topoisomerase n=1 Tax=Ditylenchus dipsaci TaxID=166011 RepID=A0A915CZ37_9BILA
MNAKSSMSQKYLAHLNWNYIESSRYGPTHWPILSCDGKQGRYSCLVHEMAHQSPVNLVLKSGSRNTALNDIEPLKFINYDQEITGVLVNTGRSVQFNVNPQMHLPEICGSRLKQHYQFVQYHFHWSQNDNEGSEHTIDGHHYPAELHLVHRGVSDPTKLAVLAVFLELSNKKGKALKPDAYVLPFIQDYTQELQIEKQQLKFKLPRKKQSFLRYKGSLTTPPCTENVVWSVFTEPLLISKSQLNLLRNIKDSQKCLIQKNTEKPILAESIAKILSDGKCHTRKGWNGACSVSEFTGNFQGRSMRYKMTSTCGHVMGLDFPMKYNSWDRVDPTELFSCPTEAKEANPKLKMPAFLSSEATNCDFLVLWLDCDKEGENICFEVIDAVKSSMNKPKSGNLMDVVFRARFSAISEKEIKHAMQVLVKPNQNESLSVDARQELDLRIGCAFTRFQTRYFQDKYGDLDSTCISFGPCQTPTLAFCVKRHDQIVQFKPEAYWVMHVEAEITEGRSMKLDWSRERIFERDVAQLFLNRVKSIGKAKIVSIVSKEGKKEKPQALNTVELLRIASSSLGLSPTTCMSVAEHLYTRGYISYPRTETTSYPGSFDFHSILRQQAQCQRYSSVVNQILSDGIAKPKGGDDKGDHPPITPMKADDGFLSGDNARVYDYVCQHFFATLMKPCKYLIRTAKFCIGSETFTVQSKTVVDPGFTSVMTWQAVSEEECLDGLTDGAEYKIKEPKLVEKETSAPGYLTESELITLMEKFGIGTDASIPVHINNICVRNYVKVESGRRLIPTTLGIALVHGFWRVDHELIQPTMRAEVETQLELIAKGKADYNSIKNHTLEIVDALFQGSFTSLADSGKPFCRCGKCRRFMKLISTKPQRLFCPNCQETYSLPPTQGGDIRLHGEKKCPIDDFELLYVAGIGGKLAKSYAFCPHCFNNPPFENMKKGVGCNECPHPGCPNSFKTQGVLSCLTECNSGKGVLVLDPQSGPKWRLTCNLCPAVVSLFEGASKLKVLDTECVECGAKHLFVEYKEGKSQLPERQINYTGCAFCEQGKLGQCLNFNHAFLNKTPEIGYSSRGRGRGRGGRGGSRRRGRGSRGRGRGGRDDRDF